MSLNSGNSCTEAWSFSAQQEHLVCCYTNEVISGCPSLCLDSENNQTATSSSCSGNGCCQTTIAKEFNYFSTMVLTMNTADRSWESAVCSLSMIVKTDFNDFGRFNISSCDDDYTVPIVLDWEIGNISCHDAVKRGHHVCGQNSKCINSTRGVG